MVLFQFNGIFVYLVHERRGFLSICGSQKYFKQSKSIHVGDIFTEKTVSHTGCVETSQLGKSTVIHHLQEKEEEAQRNPPLELRAKGKRRPLTASHVSIKIRLERNVLINKWTNEGACQLGWSARHEWDVDVSFGKDLSWCNWIINTKKVLDRVILSQESNRSWHLLWWSSHIFELITLWTRNSWRD